MGIEACPDCGNEVSNRADTCPHCCYPLAKARIEAVRNAPMPPELVFEEARAKRRKRNQIAAAVIITVIVVLILTGNLGNVITELDKFTSP